MKKIKQLNGLTTVEFYKNDLAIRQEDDYILLDKSEVLELAKIIQDEQQALELAKEKRKNKYA